MKIPLLIKHTCRVIPPGKPTAYGGTSENNYIRIYKVKQVIKCFPDKEKEINLPAYTVSYFKSENSILPFLTIYFQDVCAFCNF